MGRQRLRVEIATSEGELLLVRSAWEQLALAGGAVTPFQGWSINRHAAAIEAAGQQPHVFVLRDGDGAVHGILPLGVRAFRRGPFLWRVLQTLGPKRLDFVDLLAMPDRVDEVLRGVLAWLVDHWSRWDELRIAPVREDSYLEKAIRGTALPRTIEAVTERTGDNLSLVFPNEAHGWEDCCGGETRRSARRIVRRLQNDGFVVRSVSEGYDLPRAVGALVSLHTKRRGELGGHSRLTEIDGERLRALVCDAVAEGGDLQLLERGGTAVAAQLTLRLGEKVSHYRLAFDSAYRSWSPGIGLLLAGIDAAVKAGAREYDFGFGVEEYKRRFANVNRGVFAISLKNRHPGRAARRLFSLAADLPGRMRRGFRS